jgi:hypothetical protein
MHNPSSLEGVGGRRWEKSLQYKINIRKEEKKPTKVHH